MSWHVFLEMVRDSKSFIAGLALEVSLIIVDPHVSFQWWDEFEGFQAVGKIAFEGFLLWKRWKKLKCGPNDNFTILLWWVSLCSSMFLKNPPQIGHCLRYTLDGVFGFLLFHSTEWIFMCCLRIFLVPNDLLQCSQKSESLPWMLLMCSLSEDFWVNEEEHIEQMCLRLPCTVRTWRARLLLCL